MKFGGGGGVCKLITITSMLSISAYFINSERINSKADLAGISTLNVNLLSILVTDNPYFVITHNG